jgi:superfamily I DNA/RNA helicase
MAWDDNISGVHKEIAGSDARYVSVLAGPGTGKTNYGLMRRVARLVESGVPPREILLISFTRTAAADLRDKVAILGLSEAEGVRATTLHSFCLSILLSDQELKRSRRHPRMLLEHEEDLMLRDLPTDWGKLKDARQMLNDYVAGWDRCETDYPLLPLMPEDKSFEAEIMDWLTHHKAMLVGEVVPMVYKYLLGDPANEIFSKYKHIIIDEYQDLNFLEQRLIDLIVERSQADLCVAGDDDQSIYAFRNARPEGILSFGARDNVESFSISNCRRCPKNIVAMANSLIGQAKGREKPPLVSSKNEDGYVAIVQWDDLTDEVEGVAAAISADLESRRFVPGEILVLTNRRKVGTKLTSLLRSLEIPVHTFFRQEAVKSDPAQFAIACLQLMTSDDPVALRVILSMGGGDGRRDKYHELRKYAESEGLTERQVMDRLVNDANGVRFKSPAFISNYTEALQLMSQLANVGLAEIIDILFPVDVPDFDEIRGIALGCLSQSNELKTLTNAIVARLTQMDVPESPNYVRIMSLHKSKGLTVPCVYIMTALQGVLPHLKFGNTPQQDFEAAEEQRRLMYVALTRATNQLVISYPRYLGVAEAKGLGARIGTKDKAGRFPVQASMFVRELGHQAPLPVTGSQWIRTYPET